MTFNDVLVDLLSNLRLTDHSTLIDWDTIQQWPDNALDGLLRSGLLKPAPPAQSLECFGCEKHCFMDAIILPHNEPTKTRAFIVCDDSEMQDQMGRIQIPLERLKQWQASVKQLSVVIAGLLGLENKLTFKSNQTSIKLGMLQSKKGRRWITLNSSTLSLELNNHALPVDDVLFFEDEKLMIDHHAINDLLNRESITQSKIYTPSTDTRENKKLETLAMYQNWNDEYLRLKKQFANQSKSWCSTRISKMAIAQDRDAGTIRRNLK